MKKILLFALPVILLSGIIGCTKDGASGPTGPTGLTGLTGATGPTGPTGTVTMAMTDSVYVATGSWSLVGSEYQYTIHDAQITSSIVSKGAVEVYSWNTTYPDWYAWPDVVAGGAGLRYYYNAGTVTLLGDNFTSQPASLSVKIVAIPGSVMEQHPNTDWRNWSKVSAIISSQQNR